jgi:ribosomal protein S18 acetylase RimI-like enzyme
VEIRRATAADRDAVIALRLAFVADVRGDAIEAAGTAFEATIAAYVDDTTARGVLHSWLAVDEGGQAVGLASMLVADVPPLPDHPLAKEGYVINVWVAPDARRRGIARALMDELTGEAHALGMRRLHLYATADGRPLYEQLGFTAEPTFMTRWLDHPR